MIVALFTRAWIEMPLATRLAISSLVALFTRAWIEMPIFITSCVMSYSRPLYEGVD